MKKLLILLLLFPLLFQLIIPKVLLAMECRGQDEIDIIVGQCNDGEFRGFPYDMNSLKIYTGKCEIGSENIVSEINSGNTINLICPYSEIQRLIDQKPILEKQRIEAKEEKRLKKESIERIENFYRNIDKIQEDKDLAMEECIRLHGISGEWDEINKVWIPKEVPTYHIVSCERKINEF